jgi:hypothetical protein
MAARLSRAEHDRARSYARDITVLLLGSGPVRQDHENWVFTGGLSIHKRTGSWYDFKAGKGGHSTVLLWQHLKSCGQPEAVQSIRLFLKTHPGYGLSNGEVEEDDGEGGNLDDPYIATRLHLAHEYWNLRQPVDGTPGATWIDARLPGHGPLNPEDVAWLPPHIAHAGDGAVVFTLRCLGAVVGFELRLIDPVRNAPSQIKQNRLTYWLDRGRRRGPVTFAPFDPPVAQGKGQTIAFAEGWFDQESVRLAR